MRIAFVDIEDPEDIGTWSGTPYSILREIRKQGVQVEVIAPLKRNFKYLFLAHKLYSEISGSKTQFNRRPIALRSFAAQIERRMNGAKIDAIFSSSTIPIARVRPDIPAVFWTDAVTEAMVNYYGRAFANLSSKELHIAHEQEQSALNRASFAVYSSNWAAEVVRSKYRIAAEKLKVIEFGANLEIEHDLDDIIAFNERRLKSHCVLLFIGVDWGRKGGALAFEAAKLLNERGIRTVLKVVGGGGPEAPFVENLGFINKNMFEGQKRIKELLRTSTFLILPSRAEAAGIVFCEAAAYGLPALSTRTGGVENYISDSQTGYCLPLTASGKEYADLIANTLAAPDTYRRLSIGAFQRYKQTLNWNVGVSSLIGLIEQAIGAR
jgi:glycosyltransferase involved in cell wall biosynthesis